MNDHSAALAAFLAARPAARAQLLALHVVDNTGHCRACTIGGQAAWDQLSF